MKDRYKVAVNIFNKRANGYATKFASVAQYHDGFDFLCKQLTESSSILDLACGPGNISNYLHSIRPDLKILGVDLAPKMLEIAKVNNPASQFQVGDIRELKSLNQKFEAIVLGFGMPYLSKDEVEKVINDMNHVLSENGIVYISTMEGKYEESGFQKSSDGKDEMFIYYHEPEYIQTFMQNSGFKIIWEKHQPYFENGSLRFTDYIVVARKKGG
ncbi:MAG: class I SAM-dependent methyltransferase [Crocinitomicaceae bacterium]